MSLLSPVHPAPGCQGCNPTVPEVGPCDREDTSDVCLWLIGVVFFVVVVAVFVCLFLCLFVFAGGGRGTCHKRV